MSGVVGSANSLVGSKASDQVGNGYGSTAILPNGNYLVLSPNLDNGAATDAGAVTWGSGTAGVSGVVGSANSLVGSTAGDGVGGASNTILKLTNGNYVVRTPGWHNGTGAAVGAATWGSGTAGVSGVISAVNSLVGSISGDMGNSNTFVALTNGNYVVGSPFWDNGAAVDAGAVTWGLGMTGVSGIISAANSLVGSKTGDGVGTTGVIALTNGNYVVGSYGWDNLAVVDVGAATWCSGVAATSAAVSAANSLIGITAGDGVSRGTIIALSNGNYVVGSHNWDNLGVVDVGAATWCNGTAATSAVVSAANSLIGSTANDQVGAALLALTSNGNYVVRSSNWDNGAVINVGAATWCNGTAATSATVSATNSLIGSTANDQVGNSPVIALSNGNYVVPVSTWDNGGVVDVGAATWGLGTAGVKGAVSAANSLVGSTANDRVSNGNLPVVALPNGNYVVRSPAWHNGAAANAGAVTWGSGTAGVKGAVSAANSLVGSTANDQVGSQYDAYSLNSDYLVNSPSWDNGSIVDAGAVTLCSGTAGVSGVISAANSLVGSTAGDQVSTFAGPLPTSNYYYVGSFNWDNGAVANVGALTLVEGTGGTHGTISGCNSIVGGVANQGYTLAFGSNAVTGNLLGGLRAENKVVIGVGAPPAPTGAATQSAATVANLAATGTAIQWYAAAGGGTALAGTTPLVTGTTYYASQTVAGCESLSRLAVTAAAPSLPTITSFSPNPGGLGQLVTLTGTNLSGTTALLVNGVDATASIAGNTATSLTFRVPVAAPATGTTTLTAATGTATSPAFAVMAAPGNALAFDGVDDYLALPAGTPVPLGNSAYTIEAWVKPNAMGVYGIIGWGNYGTGNQVNALRLTATGIVNYWWGPDLTVTTPDLSGHWHHVAATFDGTTRTIYLDGVAVGSDTPGGHTVPNANNLRIGSTNNGEYFPGRIDEVRVYSTALTPAQLRADMASPGAAVPASLVLHYNFDQGTPATASAGNNAGLTTLYDLVAAVPGTLTNFALASGNSTSNYLESYALVVPVATASTARSATGFTANWTAPVLGTVTSYLLDVSTTADFASPVAGSPFAVPAPTTSYTLTGLSSTSPYHYRVRALNSSLAPADQGAFSNKMSQATPLPVELSAFTAAAEGPAVRLAWATASEQHSAAFGVERSADGRTFAAIGAVAAAGTSTGHRAYGWLDSQVPAGSPLLYYRLRLVDVDGTFAYSPVRAVALNRAVAGAGLALYPNPAPGGGATLTGAAPGAAVSVCDALGRPVATAQADAVGTAALPAGRPAGVYVVRAGTKALRLTVE